MVSEDEIQNAIEVLEQNRSILGDVVVDTAIHSLQLELNLLYNQKTEVSHQRKLMSILFIDVVDSTKLFAKLDPEDNLAIMDTSLQRLSKPIMKHGGRVTRFMGDGFLAVFGLPITRENDPERAVKSGLDILEIAKEIANEVSQKWQINEFQVRVGINTGLVVTGGLTEAEDTLMGGTVNLAARLEAAAEPGEVLISHNTFQHVRGLFEFKAVRQITAKGFKDKIQAYSVSKIIARSFHQNSRGIVGIDIPMVGRKKEFLSMQNAFMAMQKDHQMKLITIDGDMGVGKSRMIYEFENWLDESEFDCYVFRAKATADSKETPLDLFRNMLLNEFNISEEDNTGMVHSKIFDKFELQHPQHLNHHKMASVITQLLGYQFEKQIEIIDLPQSPQAFRDLGVKYFTHYMETILEKAPIVILIDNLQWSDDSSLNIYNQFKQDLGNKRLLIMTSYRTGQVTDHSLLRNADLNIHLKGLNQEESTLLLNSALCKIQDPPSEFTSLILKHMDGIPFVMEEIINMFTSAGVIFKGSQKWTLKLELLQDFRIPDTLAGIIQARIDGISETDRKVLEIGAVIGSVFWDDTIRYILHQSFASLNIDFEIVVDNLITFGLIERLTTSTYNETEEFTFSHNMIRDVIYDRILKQVKQEYHALIAAWMVDNSRRRATTIPGIIAHHYEKAENIPNAVNYFIQAAEDAYANFALKEAEIFYSKVLLYAEYLPIDKKFSVLTDYEKVLRQIGGREPHNKVIEELFRLSREQNNKEWILEVDLIIGWNIYFQGKFDKLRESAQQITSQLDDIDNETLVQDALYFAAWIFHTLNDWERATYYADLALVSIRNLGNIRQEGNILNVIGLINIAKGDYTSALSNISRFLAIAKEIKDRERVITASNNTATCYIRLGKFKEAIAVLSEVYNERANDNDKLGLGLIQVNWAWALASLQKWEEGIQYAQAGLNYKQQIGNLEAMAEGYMWLGHCQFGLGKLDLAYNSYVEALKLREKLGQTSLAMGAIAGLARVSMAKNQLQIAMNNVERILTYLENGGELRSTWEPYRIYLTCIEVLNALNDDRADDLLKSAFDMLNMEARMIPKKEDREIFWQIPWHARIKEISA